METTAASSAGAATTKPELVTESDALRDLDLEAFIRLMVVELQNQDPLNPMDNDQILEQISQIHSIESTKKLSETLDSVLLGQNLANASSLIGKNITGLSEAGDHVAGVVERVAIANGEPELVVGDHRIRLSNIEEVLPSGEDALEDAVAELTEGE